MRFLIFSGIFPLCSVFFGMIRSIYKMFRTVVEVFSSYFRLSVSTTISDRLLVRIGGPQVPTPLETERV